MLECLILGDSIAQGIAQHRPECALYARQGITSYNWNNKYLSLGLDAKHTVISLGSNDDWWAEKTSKELTEIRSNLSGRVTWILPANRSNSRTAVRAVAKTFNDLVLEIPETIQDKVHPSARAYRTLANQTR